MQTRRVIKRRWVSPPLGELALAFLGHRNRLLAHVDSLTLHHALDVQILRAALNGLNLHSGVRLGARERRLCGLYARWPRLCLCLLRWRIGTGEKSKTTTNDRRNQNRASHQTANGRRLLRTPVATLLRKARFARGIFPLRFHRGRISPSVTAVPSHNPPRFLSV